MKENNKIHLVDILNTTQTVPRTDAKSISLEKDNDGTVLIKRGIAFVVDLLTISLLKTAMTASFAIYLNSYLTPVNRLAKIELSQGNIAIHALVFLSVYFGYFLYSTFIMNGKTLGKIVMGLTVVNDLFYRSKSELNSDVSFNAAFKRSVGYLLCYFSFGTFFIFNFSSEDKRGLSDFISGSRTVSDRWLSQELERREYNAKAIYIDIAALETQEAA
jgi:uncharacterized RDD family membrane protein YckC